MPPAEVWAPVLTAAGVLLGVGLKWLWTILKTRWETTPALTSAQAKVAAAERKEDRANFQGVIEELYELLDKRGEDVGKLQADIDALRREHQECHVRMAEVRSENVNLKRHVRALRKALKDAGIDVPGWDDDDGKTPVPGDLRTPDLPPELGGAR